MGSIRLRGAWAMYAAAGAVVVAGLVVLNMPARLPRAPEALRGTQRAASAPPPGRPVNPLGVNLSTDTGAFRGFGELAFVTGGRTGALYVLSGKGVRRVASAASQPAWSPDGRWLAFLQGDSTTAPTVRILESNGHDAHSAIPGAVVALGFGFSGFAWSPKADVLALAKPIPVGGLWAVPASGSPARQLAATGTQVGSLAWSPDGRQIAYNVTLPSHHPITRSDALYTVSATGGRPVRRFVAKAAGIVVAGWWPDGKGLLFWTDPQHSASLAADGLTLYSLPLAGGAPRPLTTTLPYPDWVVSSQRSVLLVSGAGRIVWYQKTVSACAPASGVCHPLPLAPGTVSLDPAWSPRTGQLAYVRALSRGDTWTWGSCPACTAAAVQQTVAARSMAAWLRTRTLWVASPSGGGAREVRQAGVGVYAPMWSRGGHHLLYVRDNALWLVNVRGGAPVRLAGPLLPQWAPFGYYGRMGWSQMLAWYR